MKRWYESKMIWAGVAAVAIAALEAIQSGNKWPAVIIAALGALMIVLRKVTDKGIE